jgi:glycerophosphoryl diester phosphodiesterase
VSILKYATIHELLGAKPDSPIALFAHRGGYHCEEMDAAPENSISNLEKLIRMGFDGYETDMWTTADGKFLIHHDATLDRTTTGTGEVSSITFEESRRLRLKYPSGKVSTEHIPTFRELLLAGRGRTLFLVELKGGSPERFPDLVDIARETGSIDHVLFWIDWSADYASLYEQHLRSGMREVRTNVLWRARSIEALEDIVNKFDPIMVDIPPTLPELSKERGYRGYLLGILPKQHLSLVEAAQDHGIKVLVSRVTTNSYLDGLQSRGVQVFMSRAPEIQLTYLIKNGLHH